MADVDIILQAINTAIVISAVMLAFIFAQRWLRISGRRESNRTNITVNTEGPESALGVDALPLASGGFIVLNLPEDQKPLFHDLLKGFEEFARIKGYRINFSADSSVPNRIAFKFTLAEPGINVSTQRVRDDLREYIERVKLGQPLDDLPEVISPAEHHLLLTLMKNRINFLQHSYDLEKISREHYQRLLEQIPGALPTLQAPTIIVAQNQETGGQLVDSRKYSAKNSHHLAQGDHAMADDHSIADSIVIGESLNEKRNQVDQLAALIDTLRAASVENATEKNEAVRSLENVRDEISEEKEPDTGRIGRWLNKAKAALGNLSLGRDVLEQSREVFSSFGLG